MIDKHIFAEAVTFRLGYQGELLHASQQELSLPPYLQSLLGRNPISSLRGESFAPTPAITTCRACTFDVSLQGVMTLQVSRH